MRAPDAGRSSDSGREGPEGNLFDVDVRNPDNFDEVKVGDTVEITLTEAVAIDVQPAAAR